MKHARQSIREAVITLLSGIAGVTLERSRVYPMVTLPVISVYANGEVSESENESMPSPLRYSRRLQLQVDIAVEAVTGFDDTVDDYAAQVEAALAADVTLGGTATDSVLTRTTIDMDGSGDKPIAIARLQYEVWYRTTGTDPENVI